VINYIIEGDLAALSPGIRKYRVRRYAIVVNNVLDRTELANTADSKRRIVRVGLWDLGFLEFISVSSVVLHNKKEKNILKAYVMLLRVCANLNYWLAR
jgi:hypothetical protein